MTINKKMNTTAFRRPLLQCACFLSLGLLMVDVRNVVVDVVAASATASATTISSQHHHSNLRRHATTTTSSSTEPEMMVEVLVKLKPATTSTSGGFLVTQSVKKQQQGGGDDDQGFFSAQAIHSLSQRHAGKLHVHEAFAQVSLLTATVPVSVCSLYCYIFSSIVFLLWLTHFFSKLPFLNSLSPTWNKTSLLRLSNPMV
jgi:hypothetical protein